MSDDKEDFRNAMIAMFTRIADEIVDADEAWAQEAFQGLIEVNAVLLSMALREEIIANDDALEEFIDGGSRVLLKLLKTMRDDEEEL